MIFSYSGLIAQEYHFGIRGGTNFGKLVGPSEDGVDESYSWGNGFHFGIEALYSFNDYISLGTEIIYNQVGSNYSYQGQSYHIFVDADNYILTNDDVKYELNISNSYLNIPLNIYLRPIKKLEFKFGGYIGFLISPTANGKMTFGNKFNQTLNYNYYTDKTVNPYEINYDSPVTVLTTGENGEEIKRNTTKVAKAYYQYVNEGDYENGSLYNVMDFGLNTSINYFLNSSLYLGVNLQYGLADLTNDDLDRSLKSIGGNDDSYFDGEDYLIYRDDFDKNFNIQISLGFRF